MYKYTLHGLLLVRLYLLLLFNSLKAEIMGADIGYRFIGHDSVELVATLFSKSVGINTNAQQFIVKPGCN